MFLIPTLKELRRRGERNLASGAASTLYIQTGPPAACMFLSAQPPGTVFQTDTSGNLLYQGWLCLYADATNSTLRLSDLYNDGTLLTATVPTSRPSFATMLALPKSRIVARHITSASFSQLTAGTLDYTFTTNTTASVSNGQGTGLNLAGH